MLTVKQRDLLTFIQETTYRKGYAPYYDEMREHLGLQSKSGIHRMIQALEERGFIRRMKNRARAIDVVRHDLGGSDNAEFIRAAALKIQSLAEGYGGLPRDEIVSLATGISLVVSLSLTRAR